MSSDEINTAIAEACDVPYAYPPPNYYNDLNAMHEAEKVLNKMERNEPTGNHHIRYLKILTKITGAIVPFQSTSGQRCEAFLKTIGKWKD